MATLLILVISIWASSDAKFTPEIDSDRQIVLTPKDHFSFLVSSNPDGSFGFLIFTDGILTIRQEWIPVIQGIHGFRNKVDAEKLASLMINKMANGDMPPSITLHEIDSLNISY